MAIAERRDGSIGAASPAAPAIPVRRHLRRRPSMANRGDGRAATLWPRRENRFAQNFASRISK